MPRFDVIANQLSAVCLPRALPREADGGVSCKVVWDLPPADQAPDGTPTRCDQREYLAPASEKPSRNGGRTCEVRQLPLRSDADLAAVDPDHGGWYYDDFSDEVRRSCAGAFKANVAFTEFARPQAGVQVTLHCSTLQVLDAKDGGTADAAACRVP